MAYPNANNCIAAIVVLLSLWTTCTLSQCTITTPSQYKLCMSVNGNNEGTWCRHNSQEDIIVKCEYDVLLKSNPPSLGVVNNGRVTPVTFQVNRNMRELSYTVPPNDLRQGSAVFRCFANLQEYIEITVLNTQCPATPPPTLPPTTRALATLPPTTRARSSPTRSSSTGSNFTGLNPLIYTISAVILLGSLAIVAIVTCWIRARRSFNNRSLRSALTAQDYFDYLSDNEFTPLTSEEFQASLQERPPTYTQSEQIESGGGREPEETTPPQSDPEPEPTVSPQEAAIIENLIALNLLPEDSRPSRRQRRAPARPLPPVPRVSAPPPQRPPSPPEEEEGREAVERLRCVGGQAQRLLAEQRSTGQLIFLDTEDEQRPVGHVTQAETGRGQERDS